MAPNISTSDYQKLLQKIAVLETEIFQLKQSRGLKTPLWNRLGAKPKEIKERITGRTHSPVVTDLTGWPALPARHSASTPLQQWSTAKGKKSAKARIAKSPQTLCVKLVNRFTPLLEDARYLPDDSVSPSWLKMQLKEPSVSPRGVRTKNNSENKRLQGEKTPEIDPEILIVGDDAVKEVKSIRNAKVLCFPKDSVPDINDKILDLVTANPTMKTMILHIGTCDIDEKKSEVLKQHFKALFTTLKTLNNDVRLIISGPLPSMRGGDEYFSRLFALSQWLSAECINESVEFIDNFGFFWDRRHLFADGNKLNKRGQKLFAVNLRYSLKAKARAVPSLSEIETKTNESSKTSDNGAELSAKATENSDCVEKSHLCELSDDNGAELSAAPVKVTEKSITDSVIATETPHVASPFMQAQSTNGSSLKGEQATNEETGQTAKEDVEGEETQAVSSPQVEGEETQESSPDVESSLPHEEEEEEEEESSDDEEASSSEDSLADVEGESTTESSLPHVEEKEESESSDVEEVSSSDDSFALSPIPLLEFSKDMNALVSTAIKMTPRVKRQAPQPPTLSTTQTQKSVTWVIAPPPIPPRRRRKNIITSQLTSLETSFDK